jgi:iron complex transport system permease protein
MGADADAGNVRRACAQDRRRSRPTIAIMLLAAACLTVVVISIGAGALPIPPSRALASLWRIATDPGIASLDRDALVIANIRLPRVLAGLGVGAALGASGAVMQGLFRNPLADPGLVGVSGGAALAAAIVIVLGDRIMAPATVPFYMLPVGAFFGGLVSTLTIYLISTQSGRSSTNVMLLAGVAIGALAGALTGLLSYFSDDRQLRDLSFWAMGSLNGATWTKTLVVLGLLTPLAAFLPMLARGLNALAFGEAEAFHLGARVERVKAIAVVFVAIAVGASVAISGMLAFIGIVAPHAVRLLVGPNHRTLLPLSMLVGGGGLVGADALARTLLAPAELPVGILTAAIGAPFFLWLLLRRRAGDAVS